MFSGLKLPSLRRGTKESLTILKIVQGDSRRDIIGYHLVSFQMNFIVSDALGQCLSNLGSSDNMLVLGSHPEIVGQGLGVSTF